MMPNPGTFFKIVFGWARGGGRLWSHLPPVGGALRLPPPSVTQRKSCALPTFKAHHGCDGGHRKKMERDVAVALHVFPIFPKA